VITISSPSSDTPLPTVLRSRNGRTFKGEKPAREHRRIQIALLHAQTAGFVELGAGRRAPGAKKVWVDSRWREDHFLPGGQAGNGWLDPLLALADAHDQRDEELFVGVCQRSARCADKWHVQYTHWLWIDVDDPAKLPAVEAFINRPTAQLPEGRQPQLRVHSGRGQHLFWKLAKPLAAITLRTTNGVLVRNPLVAGMKDGEPTRFADPHTGEVIEGEISAEIERHNLRLIHAMGHRFDEKGRQVATVADGACHNRSRLMRLAGSENRKNGKLARIILADAARPAYQLDALTGELPDPKDRILTRTPSSRSARRNSEDPYRRLDLRDIYTTLTGREVPSNGRVHCPHREHADNDPSCDITATVFVCRSCEEGGGPYQLSAAVLGLSTKGLRGAAFKQAKALLDERVGER
jgi:hypothetical protein